jgi:hypothetical protein
MLQCSRKGGEKLIHGGITRGTVKKKRKTLKKRAITIFSIFWKKKAAAPSLDQKPEKTLRRGGLFDFFGFFSFQPGKSSLLSKKMETNQSPHFFLFPC